MEIRVSHRPVQQEADARLFATGAVSDLELDHHSATQPQSSQSPGAQCSRLRGSIARTATWCTVEIGIGEIESRRCDRTKDDDVVAVVARP